MPFRLTQLPGSFVTSNHAFDGVKINPLRLWLRKRHLFGFLYWRRDSRELLTCFKDKIIWSWIEYSNKFEVSLQEYRGFLEVLFLYSFNWKVNSSAPSSFILFWDCVGWRRLEWYQAFFCFFSLIQSVLELKGRSSFSMKGQFCHFRF